MICPYLHCNNQNSNTTDIVFCKNVMMNSDVIGNKIWSYFVSFLCKFVCVFFSHRIMTNSSCVSNFIRDSKSNNMWDSFISMIYNSIAMVKFANYTLHLNKWWDGYRNIIEVCLTYRFMEKYDVIELRLIYCLFIFYRQFNLYYVTINAIIFGLVMSLNKWITSIKQPFYFLCKWITSIKQPFFYVINESPLLSSHFFYINESPLLSRQSFI
jgi:hypothetical protein